MAQLSSLTTIPRRSAIAAASSPRVRALDPMAILEALAADCWAASTIAATEKRLWREADALRQCSRELALLLDACGRGAVAAKASAPRSPAAALSFVVHGYRAALEAPLPRALREALRNQLSRLEGDIVPARAA